MKYITCLVSASLCRSESVYKLLLDELQRCCGERHKGSERSRRLLWSAAAEGTSGRERHLVLDGH